jgi:hypothetical protein
MGGFVANGFLFTPGSIGYFSGDEQFFTENHHRPSTPSSCNNMRVSTPLLFLANAAAVADIAAPAATPTGARSAEELY